MDSWITWQTSQAPSHFRDCPIADKYFREHSEQRLEAEQLCASYCFGRFTHFIRFPFHISCPELRAIITNLLELYNSCKGIRRRIFGDSAPIIMLREAIETSEGWCVLTRHDFTPYDYDYTRIHAHTVAYFSLSTLIMRIVAHYLHYTTFGRDKHEIVLSKCRRTRELLIFGLPLVLEDGSNTVVYICGNCGKTFNEVYGRFHCCFQCHQNCVCRICGKPGTGTGDPRCHDHVSAPVSILKAERVNVSVSF
jgi:hypothetical protein